VVIISFMPEGLVPGSVRLVRWAWGKLQRKPGAPAQPNELPSVGPTGERVP
jgi:hypothetical protein